MGIKESDLEVFAVSPCGRMNLVPTTQHEDQSRVYLCNWGERSVQQQKKAANGNG